MPLAPASLALLLSREPAAFLPAVAGVCARARVYRRWVECSCISYGLALQLLQADIHSRGLALDAREVFLSAGLAVQPA